MSSLPPVPDDIKAIAISGHKIRAIKEYRDRFGGTLPEIKKLMDAFDDQVVRQPIPRPEPVRIDQTGQPFRLTITEVQTDACTVRVNTGLVDTKTGVQTIVVEIEPFHGQFETEVKRLHADTRIDVRFRRKP